MSEYTTIIFDSEKRGGVFPYQIIDSLSNYLSHGGNALFIIPNASVDDVGIINPHTSNYEEGSFFYDILRLDSAVANGLVILDRAIHGDLTGCEPLLPDYPPLSSDSIKLAASPIQIDGQIPMSGYLYPRDSVEPIYSYQSLYTDSLFHNQINGIQHTNAIYSFVMFNFPLSLMQEPANMEALYNALDYLGVDLSCGDLNTDKHLDVGDVVFLLSYLYRGGPPPPDSKDADVTCDDVINVEDAIVIINYLFRYGLQVSCCQ
jgi:hypothetical protein